MNRRRSLAIIAAALLITGLVALLLWRSEPRYGGLSLTDWAIQAQHYENLALTDKPDYLSASNAIYQMGPAAAKTAVDWLESDINWAYSPMAYWLHELRLPFNKEPRLNRQMAIPMLVRLSGEEGRSGIKERLWHLRSRPSMALWGCDFFDDLLLIQAHDTNRLADAIGTNFLWNSIVPSTPHFVIFNRAEKLLKLGPTGRRYVEAGLTNPNPDVRQVSQSILNR